MTEPLPSEPSPGLLIGRIFGVPVYVGRSWAIVGLFIVASFGPQVASGHPDWGMLSYVLAACFAVLLLFSVLVHEAAHALTGKLVGFRVQRIVADLMGGHTAYDAENATPGRSALVAAVGPISNAVLAGIGYLTLTGASVNDAAGELLVAFTWTNTFVAVFNALPGLPLDGGFLVDALVWKLTGSRAKGMKAAGWSGRVVAILVVLWAVWPLLTGQTMSSVWTLMWTLFIAMFLWRGATGAVLAGGNREFLAGIHVRDVVEGAPIVSATTPVADVPDTGMNAIVVDHNGAPTALLAPDAHIQVPLERRGSVPVSALCTVLPPGSVVHVNSLDADLTAILPAFNTPNPPARVVITTSSPQGEVIVGLVTGDRIHRAMVTHAQQLKSKA